jgi:hypothetical protein
MNEHCWQVKAGKMILMRLRCGQSELLTCPSAAIEGGAVHWNEEFIFDMSSGTNLKQEDDAVGPDPVIIAGSSLEVEIWMWGEGSVLGESGSPGPAGSEMIAQIVIGPEKLRLLAQRGSATAGDASAVGAPLRLSVPTGRHPLANVRKTDKRVHVQTENSAGNVRLLITSARSDIGYEVCPAGCGAGLPIGAMRLHLLICPAALVRMACLL